VLFFESGIPQNKNEQPIILKYADSLVGTRGENASIREFDGNVVLIQGDVTVKCNKAVQYVEENRADLIGNVHINQKDLDLYTPKGRYNGRSKIADAYNGVKITDRKTTLTATEGIYSTSTQIANFNKDVKIEDDSVVIFSDRLIYHKSNRNSFAYGNVLIKGKYSKAFLFGDTVNHYPNLSHTYVSGNPKLFQIDSVKVDSLVADIDTLNMSFGMYKFDTLSVKSITMESYQGRGDEDEVFYFLDSVEIVKGELAARADTAVYNKTNGTINLVGKPVVWYDATQLFADSISIFVPDMKLVELRSVGNSVVISKDDTSNLSRINLIIGNEIVIKFENDSINAIFSNGNAKSLYFMSSDSASEGAQRSSCDSLVVLFELGEVNEINWLGGINGEFFPEDIIAEPKTLYLPGFKMFEYRPEKIYFSLKRFD